MTPATSSPARISSPIPLSLPTSPPPNLARFWFQLQTPIDAMEVVIKVLHPQSMRPARESDVSVRVKNSYNREAPGTLITKTRDMSEAVLTSIVLKPNITLLDIVSSRMLGQYGFLAKVFSIFEELKISVDSVATSEVSVSLTLDPSKIWSRELIPQASICFSSYVLFEYNLLNDIMFFLMVGMFLKPCAN